MQPRPQTLAVALHEVEPATFERCRETRAWLSERGVDRVTLLAIPARDLHPLGERSPELAAWLAERRRQGDSIAQQGFQHEQLGGARWTRRRSAYGRRAAEFAGLDREEARRAVEAGWRLLKLAGIEPDGFVAPAYLYTPALLEVVRWRFRWWAGRWGLHGGREGSWRRLAPAWSPASAGAGALLAGTTLRVDLTPTCLRRRRHLRALEWALERAGERRAITYDELADAVLRASERPPRARGLAAGALAGALPGSRPAGDAAQQLYDAASRETSVVPAPSSAVAAAALRQGRA